MEVDGIGILVTGAASGLGRATALRLARAGGRVVGVDLPSAQEHGQDLAIQGVRLLAADVLDSEALQAAIRQAAEAAPLRAVVHCAGRGGPVRVVDKDGRPGSLDTFEAIVRTNLVGTFNVLRLAAAQMATNDILGGDRGVVVLTASIAAYEGQAGQAGYASSKAGVAGLTLVAARDLAPRSVRVCAIAPGLFDTPMLARVPDDVRKALAASAPHPPRLGSPEEFASLAQHIVENPMLNGEVIRLDGALRMGPR